MQSKFNADRRNLLEFLGRTLRSKALGKAKQAVIPVSAPARQVLLDTVDAATNLKDTAPMSRRNFLKRAGTRIEQRVIGRQIEDPTSALRKFKMPTEADLYDKQLKGMGDWHDGVFFSTSPTGYTYFSSHTKTKLKFNPDIGTDVALPTPNPVTQYLSTSPTDKDIVTGRSDMLLSTASSASQPSAASILRGTPASSTSQYRIPAAPLSSTMSSEPLIEAGRSKPEMSTLNSAGGRDTRSTLDTRAITKGTKKLKGAGLLGRNPNRNYYRQVLNAI